MRYPPGHNAQAKASVLAGASRAFRKHGHAGVGVDGLAKEAGVTSGAFYTHFKSKDQAFYAAVVTGMEELLVGIKRFRADHASKWLDAFVDWYVGAAHRKDLACGCALVTLSPEVMRSGKRTRAAYSTVFDQIVEEIADGLATSTKAAPISKRREHARAILSILAGSVTLSRSMSEEAAAEAIATGAKAAIDAIVRAN